MLWRAPWLRHRLALMGLAAWDAASLYICYNLTFVARRGRWEGWSAGLLVITLTWLGFSYLAGRYSPAPTSGRGSATARTAKTLLAACAVIGVFVSHSWVYQVIDAETRFRGFLIPLVVGACILSTIGQAMQNRISNNSIRWVLAGSEVESRTLSRELESEREELVYRTKVTNTEGLFVDIESIGNNEVGIGVGIIDDNRNKVMEKLLQLKERGRCVLPLLSWCEQELQRIPPELVDPEWLIQADGFGLRPGSISWRIKRFGDVVGALTLIAVTAPIIIVCSIMIWAEDKGPIFYKQTRSGLYGRPIRIWKLRSMKVNSESAGAQWASRSDPRITRVGKLIRATRIDELPQLFSVLNGDLSLIGPRPERPEMEETLEEVIPNYRIRHWIRPGLSGWAQVCYQYGASVEDSRMKLSYDLYYLRNASLFLDILITMKTARLVIGARGATPSSH